MFNWGRGVEWGLRTADYRGGFHNSSWQTGLGALLDHNASVQYKRSKAKKLAAEIQTYEDHHPGAPVNLIALSAGTAVAVFALEALPREHQLDNVVLLGSSISNHYDLTEALRRVRNRVFVLTSEKDAVLSLLVATSGTADRQFCGACSAGLHGFHLPQQASAETKRLYGKMQTIAWRSEFEKWGNFGGHTDAANPKFIKRYVAPLLLEDDSSTIYTAVAAASEEARVAPINVEERQSKAQ